MSNSAAGDLARMCHGIAVRLPRMPEMEEVRANLARAAGQVPALKSLRVWAEPVAFPAGDARSARRRATELRRAPAPEGPGLRAVFLEYADGPAELVIVAHRAVLTRDGLRGLAGVLTGSGGPAGEPPTPAGPPAPAQDAGARTPAWGLGDPARAGRHSAVALGPVRASGEELVRAASLVLSRYTGGEDDAVGVLRDDDAEAERACVGVVLSERRAGEEYEPCAAPYFPLTLWAERQEDGTLRGECRFDEDAVAPEIASRFARQVARAAERLAAGLPGAVEPDAEEIAELLAVGAGAPLAGHAPTTIHAAFEKVAAARPGAVAYTGEDATLDYAELDRRAERRARALRGLGAGPGELVGVCLERGADLVVTLLAVLKSGAAYLPMDVRHPRERLRATVEDAGARIVVAEDFPPAEGRTLVRPADLDAAPEAGHADGPQASPDDPAYVIFTSGSTGRPKGVVIPHRNVPALLAAVADDMRLGPEDVWTWFHSAAFDFSVWEIWGCLLTGGRLVMTPYWVSRAPHEFHRLLAEQRVTVLSQTPSAFAQLIHADAGTSADLAVRLVILGGEPLDVRILKEWFADHPPARCRVVNMFGITETTVHVTAQTVTAREMVERSRSVGGALPGWTVSVRDPEGRPVPFGAAGEIYVGGAGVALGYLNRPELTAERFVDDPYGGGRLYRSGDRGRLRPDGRLDHLGRLDNQVQLRGFRIELDEVRAALVEDPAVRAAAVVLNEEGDPRLDAYVVPAGPGPAVPAEIRGRLGRILPDYMIPGTITVLDDLPLTVNGKVDTARLPAPSAGAALVEEEPAPARGEGPAAAMLEIWRRAFGAPVSLDDDFFELGGNSLLAIRISAAMREAGLPQITLRDFYLNPTIRGLEAAMTTR
ncbi:amino acid adenylation domain-containing protein [Thermocatellispora tengchongensis]|uniref:Amino acid adenylation domain-containing protein n=2 Tax=Thermocatellispora tengchongensis TaxID=1073253 RepID=A0A840P764_9ACTN|nr:non-ribosomal peptide synthetase [Thermocatellispora tengchongensis]MBB5135508.1 amino acid adenylation domain-containing protein [Thermocatellispora tengchongensis]